MNYFQAREHCLWNRRSLFNCVVLLTLALGLGSRNMVAQENQSPAARAAAEEHHKIQVHDPVLAAQLKAQGGRLIADYGSSQLYEAAQISPDLATNSLVEFHDEYNVIMLNASKLDTRKAETKALRKAVGGFAGKRMHLVHFAGPVQPAWREQLVAAGVQIITYIPQNAYLVYGDAKSIAQVQGMAATAPHVQWEGKYLDDYKIHPAARAVDKQGHPRPIGTDAFTIQLVADPAANANTLQLLDRLKLEPIQRQQAILNYLNLVVRLTPKAIQVIAAQPDVVSIQPYFARQKFCERQDQIIAGNLSGDTPTGPGYLAWLAGKGFTQAQFTASGFSVDVTDSGLDNGTSSPNHFGLYAGGDTNNTSRVVYNRLEGTPNNGSTLNGCDGHGTLNSHIIGGFNNRPDGFPHTDDSGFHYGLGVCPFVKIGSSVIFDPASFTGPDYTTLQSSAYNDGARVSNNSWGADAFGDYDVEAQTYDALVRDAQPDSATFPTAGNQEMVIVFAAGNSGPRPQTVGAPGSAKNVITVGASENVQVFGGEDGSHVNDAEADSANDMAPFSSRGPCSDGRHKPDLVAPGTHVSGGVAQDFNPGVDGTADLCFTGEGVSGGVGDAFFPAGQQFFTASSGTSHSTPCVAGGCALVRQYFINHFTNPPSPAMTKGYLMNSARYMTGVSANDTLWSDSQGMGEMNLGFAFDGTPRILRDEVPADLFTASGQTRTFTGTISDTNKPFRVTVVWTDAPGNTTGNAYNNDLDLTVTVGGNTYKGNVFNGAYSSTGGTADTQNNVESVFLPAGVSGSFSVQVTAANINSDGVPNNTNALDQDFAIVIYNGTGPIIATFDPNLGAENCFPTNGVIDPGETVTMSFTLKNVGTASTANLVATLLADGGVVAPNGPQAYGGLTPGGAAASRSFTFTADGTCGGTITATLQLQDGPANLGAVTFNLPLGKFVSVTPLTESFDGVLAPALPGGWTNSVSGGALNWVTSSGTYDTAPHAAFAAESTNSGVAELTTPSIPISSPSAQLTFRSSYNFEVDFFTPSVAYDGGVLEIAIGNGVFTDILAAGGSFAAGGYTRTVAATGANPLDGREVWSGNSGGFITTIVDLPATAAGQNIQLKWRFGTDTGNAGGGTGWHIDTVSIQQGYYTCCDGLFAPTILNPRTSGGNTTFSFQTVSGQTYNVEYKNTLTNSTWTTLQSFSGDGSIKSITNALSTPQRYYRVRSP
jgi:hypothetical protein